MLCCLFFIFFGFWFNFYYFLPGIFGFPCVFMCLGKAIAGFKERRLSFLRIYFLLLWVLHIEVFSARLNAIWVLQFSFSGIKERHPETLHSVLSFFNVGFQNVNQMSL